MESLGDSITTAVLLSWSKQPGDMVKEDDVIGVVETDKVTMDIRAKKSGVFVEALFPAGAEISVGNDLYVLDTSASASAQAVSSSNKVDVPDVAAASPIKESAAVKGEKVIVPVPVMGESITQGVLAKWDVKVGDFVAADAVVASIETDKVTVEVRSPQDGTIAELFAAEGAEITVGGQMFAIIPGVGTPSSSSTAKAAAPSKEPAAVGKAAPKVDTKVAAKAASSKPSPADSKTSTSPTKAAVSPEERTETRVKMTRMRLRIAQRLKEAQNTAAMLTTFQECDMTNLISLRNKYKDDFEKVHGVKLGFMSAFVKVSPPICESISQLVRYSVNYSINQPSNPLVKQS